MRIYIGGDSPVVGLVKSEDILLTSSASLQFKNVACGGLVMFLKWNSPSAEVSRSRPLAITQESSQPGHTTDENEMKR
jgi:hypothetical protein